MSRRKPEPKNVERLLQALAFGATLEAASRQAGVSIRTAKRRMAERGFRTRLCQLRGDLMGRTAGMLTATTTEAVKALHDLLKNGKPALKHSAARTVLEFATKLREIVDLETRMQELEEELEELQGMADKRDKERRK